MITFAVLPVLALLVAAPSGPEDGCPSGHQVTEAMQARFPASLVMSDQALGSARADILRATLDAAPDGTVVRFSLIDSKGEVQLRRTLPAPGRSRSVADCLALADTVAAIVERYLGTITYNAAETAQNPTAALPAPGPHEIEKSLIPLSTPRRSGLAFLGIGWRTITGTTVMSDQSGLEGRLGAQFELTRVFPRIAGVASAGAASALSLNLQNGERIASLRRFPVRLGLLLELQAGSGWIESSLQSGVDVLVLSSTRRVAIPSDLERRFGPVIEAGVAYRLKVAGRFYLRPTATISVPLKTYEYAVRDGSDSMSAPAQHLLTTPRLYASFGIDAAVVFR